VWRKLHKVWQPAFYTDSVHACAPLMAGAAQQLCARLQSLAALGHPLDIWREIGNLTMATVGTAAFGWVSICVLYVIVPVSLHHTCDCVPHMTC
jgi:cytochrome P450